MAPQRHTKAKHTPRSPKRSLALGSEAKIERSCNIVFLYTGRCRGVSLIYQVLQTDFSLEAKAGPTPVAEGTIELKRKGPDSFETHVEFIRRSQAMYEIDYWFLVDGVYRATHAPTACPPDTADPHKHRFIISPEEGLAKDQLVVMRHSSYSFDTRIASQHSQYNIPLPADVPPMGAAAASACSSIACTFIYRVLSTRQMLHTTIPEEVDSVLVEGIKAHAAMHAQNAAQGGPVEHMGAHEALLLNPQLSKLLVAKEMVQGTCSQDKYEQVTRMLQESALNNCDGVSAATLTTQFVTIALVCRVVCEVGQADEWGFHMFDSHKYDYGDGQPDGATLLNFSGSGQLQQFLQERFAMDADDFMLDVYEATLIALEASEPTQNAAANSGSATLQRAPAQQVLQQELEQHKVRTQGTRVAPVGSSSSQPCHGHQQPTRLRSQELRSHRITGEDDILLSAVADALDHLGSQPVAYGVPGAADQPMADVSWPPITHHDHAAQHPAGPSAAPILATTPAGLPMEHYYGQLDSNWEDDVQQYVPRHGHMAVGDQPTQSQVYRLPTDTQPYEPHNQMFSSSNSSQIGVNIPAPLAAGTVTGPRASRPCGTQIPVAPNPRAALHSGVTQHTPAPQGQEETGTQAGLHPPAHSRTMGSVCEKQPSAVAGSSKMRASLADSTAAGAVVPAVKVAAQSAPAATRGQPSSIEQLSDAAGLGRLTLQEPAPPHGVVAPYSAYDIQGVAAAGSHAANVSSVAGAPPKAASAAAAVDGDAAVQMAFDGGVPTVRSVVDAIHCCLVHQLPLGQMAPPLTTQGGSLLRYCCKKCLTANCFTDIVGAEDVVSSIRQDETFVCRRDKLACFKGQTDVGKSLLCKKGHRVGVWGQERNGASPAEAHISARACYLIPFQRGSGP